MFLLVRRREWPREEKKQIYEGTMAAATAIVLAMLLTIWMPTLAFA
jgi:hypothetical protein